MESVCVNTTQQALTANIVHHYTMTVLGRQLMAKQDLLKSAEVSTKPTRLKALFIKYAYLCCLWKHNIKWGVTDTVSSMNVAHITAHYDLNHWKELLLPSCQYDFCQEYIAHLLGHFAGPKHPSWSDIIETWLDTRATRIMVYNYLRSWVNELKLWTHFSKQPYKTGGVNPILEIRKLKLSKIK